LQYSRRIFREHAWWENDMQNMEKKASQLYLPTRPKHIYFMLTQLLPEESEVDSLGCHVKVTLSTAGLSVSPVHFDPQFFNSKVGGVN
jgi:hypothetical protein